MASALSSELTCPICLELFTDPVTLPCMHSYCRNCLKSILQAAGGTQMQCPECRYIATMNAEDLEKLPRNFFIVNIVEKYKKVDDIPKIPCDICEGATGQSAIKSCQECKISYCGQCLFLHPRKGVLASHSLIEPTEYIQKRPVKFCMKCLSPPHEGPDVLECTKDHIAEVLDNEVAKLKIRSKIQDSYSILNERIRKYQKDLYRTEDFLNGLQPKVEETKLAIKQKIQRRCESILEEFSCKVKEAEEKGQQYLLQLQGDIPVLSEILQGMKAILQKEESETNFEELLTIQKRATTEVGKETRHGFDIVLPHFDLSKKFTELFVSYPEKVDQNIASTTPLQLSQTLQVPIERVKILSCSTNIRRIDQGASVTITWSSNDPRCIFTLKLLKVATVDTKSLVITNNVTKKQYEENNLQHNTTYEVTVSVQDRSETESESHVITTLPGIPCEDFHFNSLVKSKEVDIDRSGKCMVRSNSSSERNNAFCGLKRVPGAVGTLVLNQTYQYWEVRTTFHLRGKGDDQYRVAMGICADGKFNAIPNIVQNYHFYGLCFGKGESGSPEALFFDAGMDTKFVNIKPERSYMKKIGFFYNPQNSQLEIVDVEQDSVMHISGKLKPVQNDGFSYYPICAVIDDEDSKIELITGSDIVQIPSCLKHIFA